MANLILDPNCETVATVWDPNFASTIAGQSTITNSPANTAASLPNGLTSSIRQTNISVNNTDNYYLKFYLYVTNNMGELVVNLPSSIGFGNFATNAIFSANDYTQRQYTEITRGPFTFTITAPETAQIIISSQAEGNELRVSGFYLGTSSQFCFNKGTKILSLNENNEEQYIPIEKLQDGDLVKTYLHGYRKIHKVVHSIFKNNVNEFTKSMYVMAKQGDMSDDLIVTGGHSILVDDYESEELKEHHRHLFGGELDPIDGKQLLLAGQSPLFKQIQGDDIFDIYHLCLEGENEDHDKRYGIWANGVLTESTYKKIIYNILKK